MDANARSERRRHPRGIAAVLAMMFLVIFGSLGVAMAVVAEGNLRTADSGLKVSRAMSAAETGLAFAARRLETESARFVVRKGTIDAGFASRLWNGTWTAADGTVEVLPPRGFVEQSPARSLAEALRNAHAADLHAFAAEPVDAALPAIDGSIVRSRANRTASGDDRCRFRIAYELLPGTGTVRVTSQGADGEIRRTLQMDFEIDKRIEFAVLSPNRIMIGKNVRVIGPLGTGYGTVATDLAAANGDPLVMRNDFRYLDEELNATLDLFRAAVVASDVDGDGRLRPGHPTEAQGIATVPGAADLDGDEYVDEFDLFLSAFDADGDGAVAYDPLRAAAAGVGSLPDEFGTVDPQLGRLIDRTRPDRNGDGEIDAQDTRLGYDDGVIDWLDRYAKVDGRLEFGVTRSAWETANLAQGQPAHWRNLVEGAIRTPPERSAVRFGVPPTELRMVTTDMFGPAATWFRDRAGNPLPSDPDVPEAAGAWEPVPYGSAAAYDWYRRPVFENRVFTDLRIPVGSNALFRNCTFVGVTYVETTVNCTDVNWNYVGSLKQIDHGEEEPATYETKFPGLTVGTGGSAIYDTKPLANSLRFEDCTFLGSIAGDTPAEFTHWRNKIQLTGNTRFYVDPDDPELLAQDDQAVLRDRLLALPAEAREGLAKSSIMLPGWSVDVGNFTNETAEDPDETRRISLSGTIVAGVLDIRGTARVRGTLLMTFRPVADQGPLFYNGKTDAFNTTLGYFGPLDGDGEGRLPGESGFAGFGEITLEYDPEAGIPDGIPWPVTVDPVVESYREGGVLP
jgi:hypothetical protein